MKKLMYSFLITFVLFLLSSCSLFEREVIGTGEYISNSITTENATILDIEDIKLKYKNRYMFPTVTMAKSDEKKVTIYADESLHDDITVKLDGKRLRIYGDRREVYNTEKLEIVIEGYTFEEVYGSQVDIMSLTYSTDDFKLDLSGASNCEADTIICDSFELVLSGATSFECNEVNTSVTSFDLSGASSVETTLYTEDLDLEVSGASNAKIEGSTKSLNCDISGASDVDAIDFETENANVDISGDSDVSISFTESLKGELSGASTLKYKGDKSNVDVETSGASSVKQVN